MGPMIDNESRALAALRGDEAEREWGGDDPAVARFNALSPQEFAIKLKALMNAEATSDGKRHAAVVVRAMADHGDANPHTLDATRRRLIASGEWDSMPSDFGPLPAEEGPPLPT